MNMGVYHSFEKKEKATMFFLKKTTSFQYKATAPEFFPLGHKVCVFL